MRFIIHELPYEQPLARGLWRYEQDGRPTGAVEQWRLSAAQDGYHFLRIDLDGRRAPSGRSYLYHLVLDENGRPSRLQYRLWRMSSETMGNVLLEKEHAVITSGTGDNRLEEVIRLPEGYQFWFPSSVALGLLARTRFRETRALALVAPAAQQEELALLPLVTSLRQESVQDGIEQPVRLRWLDQERALWLDESGWPVRLERQDGLTAVETQLIYYGRINGPGVQAAAAVDAPQSVARQSDNMLSSRLERNKSHHGENDGLSGSIEQS